MTVEYIIDVDDPPTPVEQVYEVLDPGHCAFCRVMGTGQRAWWTDPETIEGMGQIEEILKHCGKEVVLYEV